MVGSPASVPENIRSCRDQPTQTDDKTSTPEPTCNDAQMGVTRRYDLVARMRDLGVEDPEGWAQSELQGDIPQEARWLILRRIWAECIDGWTADDLSAVPAARRAVDAGAAPEDVVRAMRAAAYEAAFGVLALIDEGYDAEAPADAPGWRLNEVRFDEAEDGLPSGRVVAGLHESVLSADPSAREGADLWE
jgi:hypothetical protein